MNDLETLRPEVQAAMRTMNGQAGGNRDDAYDVIEAELLRLTDENARLRERVSDTEHFRDVHIRAAAIFRKRAEKAEAELAALKSQTFRGRAQDAIDRFAVGEELSHEEMCEVVNQAVCAERELAALKARRDGSRHVFLGPNMDRITFLAEDIGPVGEYALVKVED